MYKHHFETPIGRLGVMWDGESKKVHRLMLPGDEDSEGSLVTREYETHLGDLPSWLSSVISELHNYFSGSKVKFSSHHLNFDKFTEFQMRVHHHVFAIPNGETRTYSQIAREVNSPGAARAVGNVMAQNPYPIIVPCHRIVAQNGGLGGYRGGLNTKKFLLALEQTPHN